MSSVYEYLGDYREGRLGNVRELPHVLLECLRAASAELEVAIRVQNAKVMDG